LLNGEGLFRNYAPATNYCGSDSFTFRVSDGRRDSEIATVSIAIDPVPDTTTGTLSARLLGNGQYLLNLRAAPLHLYRIDVSTDLIDWAEWLSVRTDASGADSRSFRFHHRALSW